MGLFSGEFSKKDDFSELVGRDLVFSGWIYFSDCRDDTYVLRGRISRVERVREKLIVFCSWTAWKSTARPCINNSWNFCPNILSINVLPVTNSLQSISKEEIFFNVGAEAKIHISAKDDAINQEDVVGFRLAAPIGVDFLMLMQSRYRGICERSCGFVCFSKGTNLSEVVSSGSFLFGNREDFKELEFHDLAAYTLSPFPSFNLFDISGEIKMVHSSSFADEFHGKKIVLLENVGNNEIVMWHAEKNYEKRWSAHKMGSIPSPDEINSFLFLIFFSGSYFRSSEVPGWSGWRIGGH